MAEENATLATFYDSWKLYQDHLTQAIAPLSAEQLGLRAAPGLRTIGELVAHIIGARVGWFSAFLGEEVGALARWRDPGATLGDAAALVDGLDDTWRLMAGALARWSDADMRQTFAREWRGDQYELSRAWVVWHLLEHDLHHGGEVSLTLGMHGLQAPDI
jgi:uncharacterized damage-inducible protein DinB